MNVALQELGGGGDNVSGGPGLWWGGGQVEVCEGEGQAALGRASRSGRRGCVLEGGGRGHPRPESWAGGKGPSLQARGARLARGIGAGPWANSPLCLTSAGAPDCLADGGVQTGHAAG